MADEHQPGDQPGSTDHSLEDNHVIRRPRRRGRRPAGPPIHEPPDPARRDYNGLYIETHARRVEWQNASDKLAEQIFDRRPRVQRNMTLFVVRCPNRGCLLGRVYKHPLRDGGVRYLWIGVTAAGVEKAAIINWAWDGDRGAKRWVPIGCGHGAGSVEIGWLYAAVEAFEDWGSRNQPDGWLAHYPAEVQRGYRRRTLLPVLENWSAKR